MSITAETAKEHAHDPAVLCCRAEAGITIEPANLEDPAIFDDLVDSGLLNLDGCLTIEEVLGAKLTKTCDSLCPLTNDVLDGVKAPTTEAPAEGSCRGTGRGSSTSCSSTGCRWNIKDSYRRRKRYQS